jgi:hypothetical protein
MHALRLFAKPGIRIHFVLICGMLSMPLLLRANAISTDSISTHVNANDSEPAVNADVHGEAFVVESMHFVEPTHRGVAPAVSDSSFTVPWGVRGGLLLLPILAFKHFRRKGRDS